MYFKKKPGPRYNPNNLWSLIFSQLDQSLSCSWRFFIETKKEQNVNEIAALTSMSKYQNWRMNFRYQSIYITKKNIMYYILTENIR